MNYRCKWWETGTLETTPFTSQLEAIRMWGTGRALIEKGGSAEYCEQNYAGGPSGIYSLKPFRWMKLYQGFAESELPDLIINILECQTLRAEILPTGT